MAIIVVTCIDYTKITEQTLEKCCASTDYSIHPVFRIRKCISNLTFIYLINLFYHYVLLFFIL